MADEQDLDEPGRGLFIAIGLDVFLELERRVSALEQRGTDTLPADLVEHLEAQDERLGRHRGDIEALKQTTNAITRYLGGGGATGPTPTASSTKEPYL